MALEFLSNLWKVIKREFWNSDECSEDEVTRPETKDNGVPISRQNVDSKDGVGRNSKNYMFSCREYDYGDDFINNFVFAKRDEVHEAQWQHSSLQCEHIFMENLLFQFYEHLHDYLRKKYSVSDHSIQLAMKKLIFNYKNLDRCETPEALNFNDMSTCLGYLHRYAICHAALVYHAITKILKSSTLFLSIFSSKKLDIMCLGSGPGNDFIGFAFALMNSRIKILNIDITVVDMYSGWYTIFTETLEMFNSLTKNAYEKPSKTFIQADLSNFSSWNSFMKKRLNDVDLVSLVKVLSNIPKDAHAKTLKNIVRLMKDDAFLIIIDCPLPSAELSALEHFLQPVYSSDREKFNFKEKKTRFGYPNISQCTAYTRVYRKRNSVLFR